MNKTNISNIANHIKSQLPTYISSDEEYSKFVKFLELYYEWMSNSDAPSGVLGNMTEYGDIDDTLDMFVSLYKNELANAFPSVTKIRGVNENNSNAVRQTQLGNSAESATESLYDQEFLMDGSTSSYKLSYFNPYYYFGETDATSKVDEVVVFKNPATDSANRGSGTSLQSFIDALDPPSVSRTGASGDYVKLVENTDYVLDGDVIKFITAAGDPNTMLINDIVKVRFYVKTYLDVSTTADTEDGVKKLVESVGVKKTTYENQRNFLKFMKDFYQSKGTEKSYDFLFRAIFNEPIEIYYPKDNLFKSSNNIWERSTSVRAKPYVQSGILPAIQSPYKIIGKTSKAEATVNYYNDFKVGNYDVREYFITNIFGDFGSQETITVYQTDGTKYEEELYECVVGFDITNGGTDYSRNQPLHYNLTSAGSGSGFSAIIGHTSTGKVESVNIGHGGDGYIDGEHIEFIDDGTLGYGATAKVTGTTSTVSNYNVLFNQNPISSEYIANGPQTIFNIGLSGDNYHDTARDTAVTIENVDSLSDSVFGLFDFESIDNSIITVTDDTKFSGKIPDLKFNMNAIRIDTSLVSTVSPPLEVTNIDPTSSLDTRYKNDLIVRVDSVDSNGSITGVSAQISINRDTGGTVGSSNALADKTSSNGQVLPSPVSLTNQTGRYESGNGFGAKFDVSISNNILTSINMSSGGSGFQYLVDDVLKIDGRQFSSNGITGTNDVLLKVTSVSTGTNYNGIVKENLDDSIVGYTTNTVSGQNASWNVSTGMTPYPRLFVVRLDSSPVSVGYKVNDIFIIPGTSLGGTTPSNDIRITVTQVDSTGRIEEFDFVGSSATGQITGFSIIGTPVLPDYATNFYNPIFSLTHVAGSGIVGFNAKFFIQTNGTTYIVNPPPYSDRGQDYSIGDIISISGTQLGGNSTNNLTFEISSVSSDGGITGISSISGTATNAYSLLESSARSVRGTGALLDIDIVNEIYSASVSAGKGGVGYNVGQILTFSGSRLAHEWIRSGFREKLDQVGKNALFTDSGYMRITDVGESLRENSTDGISIDFWYFRKGTEISSDLGGASIFSINDRIGGTQKTYLQQNPDGTLTFGNGDLATGVSTSSSSISFGEWHHIAVYLGAAESKVYVDGEDYISISDNSYFDISEYGNYTETVTITSSNVGGVTGMLYNPDAPVKVDVTYLAYTSLATWAATTAYTIGDLVSLNGRVYRATLTQSSGNIGPNLETLVDGDQIWENAGPLVAPLPNTIVTSTNGTDILWPDLSVGDQVSISYSKPQKNFYLGARQKVELGNAYSIEDYNHAFFGTLRFTQGKRYDEVASPSTKIEDTGTDNSITGIGLNPVYVNPIPSLQSIRNSTPKTVTYTVTETNKSGFSFAFDINENPSITRSVTSLNGLGESVVATSNLIGPDETDGLGSPLTAQFALVQALDESSTPISGMGSGVTFSPDLGVGESIEITYLSHLEDDIEYIIRDQNHPVIPNRISLRKSNDLGIYSTYALPDGHSLRVTWNSKPRSAINATSVTTSGNGYMKKPYGYIADKSFSYTSRGEGAWFIGHGNDIGNIEQIDIQGNSFQSEREGFGVDYTTPPVLDLSTFGDGTATATVITGPVCIRAGEYLNQQGFLSDNNRIYDGYLWQDYSYVVKVGRYIDDWRKIVKKVVHPAGLMMFGEYSITTDAVVRRGAGIAWTQLIYEIIKNVNMKVKNMDGLGRWAYTEHDGHWFPTTTRQDTNYLNSHGNIFTYDNRQLSVNSTIGAIYDGVGEGEVSDDTAGAASVDNGSGRYALLQADGTNAPAGWWQVKKIALNFREAFGKDYSHYYTSGLIGNTVTVYDTSDTEIVPNEWINTRPWGKYKITGALIDASVGERYIVFDVDMISGYLPDTPTWDNSTTGTGGPNKVEFRWDNIFRGNVDRGANSWIGSISDGANPRDEKMIINISGRYNNNKIGDVPTLHTTWKSLERFKFYFRDIYPWKELVQQMFSPSSEMENSPYNVHRKLVTGNSLTHISVKHPDYNMWYNVPIDENGDDEWIANTDGTDHKWRNTVMSDVVTKSDRKYRAVLDSTVNIIPVYLIMSEENPLSGTRKRMGPTNLSVERAKFNNKVQPSLDYNVDRIDYDENLLDLNTVDKFITPQLHDKSNFASESTVVKYTVEPTTLAQLKTILDSTPID